MAIILEKGGQAESIKFARLQIGLGWDPVISNDEETFDLDVSAFMLGSNKKSQVMIILFFIILI